MLILVGLLGLVVRAWRADAATPAREAAARREAEGRSVRVEWHVPRWSVERITPITRPAIVLAPLGTTP